MNSTTQLVMLMYQYLFHKGDRLERELMELVDRYYYDMFRKMPEKYVDNYNLLNLIETKARFDEFCVIQRELFSLLKSYNSGGINNPDYKDKS